MQTPPEQTNKVRSSFVARLFRMLLCWKTARRALLGLAALATLLAIFYSVENWRGQRAWENAKRELAAKGEVLDWSAYIPPPVQDEQNIFTAPNMQEWFVRISFQGSSSNSLSARLTNAASATVGNPNNVITNAAAARAYLEWSDTLTNEFNLIRQALERPYSRMEGDYQRPFEMPLPNFVTMRSLAQTLAQRAHCELLLGRPGDALNDLTLVRDMRHLLEGRPTGRPMSLVAAMINVAITGLYVNEIAWGMESGNWQEPQLIALQKQLEDINLVSAVADSVRSERAAACHMFENSRARDVATVLSFRNPRGGFFKNHSDPLYLLYAYAPRGWVNQNLARIALIEQEVVEVLDSSIGLIRPTANDAAMRNLEESVQTRTPFTILAWAVVPHFTKAFQTTARNQTLVNQGAIACALERHRLANGHYPETLDALVPQFIEKLPHDIIGGQPLRYQRTATGKYLLYSVGWNEKDDGGEVVTRENGVVDTQSLDGDWVWPGIAP